MKTKMYMAASKKPWVRPSKGMRMSAGGHQVQRKKNQEKRRQQQQQRGARNIPERSIPRAFLKESKASKEAEP